MSKPIFEAAGNPMFDASSGEWISSTVRIFKNETQDKPYVVRVTTSFGTDIQVESFATQGEAEAYASQVPVPAAG